MAIAGIGPARFATFDVDYDIGALEFDEETDAQLVWGWHSEIHAYSANQVREILIKFASQHVLFGSGEPVSTVDEFMKDGEES